jgi:hypothetical protein
MQIGAATSGTMVLFSSSTALVAFSASGRLNAQYAAVFSVASMIAAVLGSVVIGGWASRKQHFSHKRTLVISPSTVSPACSRLSVTNFECQKDLAYCMTTLNPVLPWIQCLCVRYACCCRIVRRTGRVSLLVLSMAVVMLVGGGAVGGFGVVTIIQAVKNNHLGPTQLCP